MSVHETIVVGCDHGGCDRAIIPTGPQAASRITARAFARDHGWATADRHPAWVDLCPTHAGASPSDRVSPVTGSVPNRPRRGDPS